MQNQKIIILGAGKVAQQICKQCLLKGVEVLALWSRNYEATLYLNLNVPIVKKIEDLPTVADTYIVCVSDAAIADVAAQLPLRIREQRLVVHCSGATPMTVLEAHCAYFGIFYPLQTFSVNSKPDWSQIPICVSSNVASKTEQLRNLAKIIGNHIYDINDKQRLALHVAAVFVNNFTNHLFAIGEDICNMESVSFDILKPLIAETAAKILHQSPAQAQTGPAIRNDVPTIKRHESFLEDYPADFLDIYKLMSKAIQEE